MSPRCKQPLSVEHALLGFVREQPLHGYELYQRMLAPDALGLVWNVGQSQFYALLAKLEQEGYLTSTVERQDTHPPRKVHHLTPEGDAAFAGWVSDPVRHWKDIQPEFLAKLTLARQMGDAFALDLVARQRHTATSWLDTLRTQMRGLSAQSSVWLTLQWQFRQVEAFVDWLDACAPARTDGVSVAYPIAVLRNSPHAEMAQRFVDYVCSPTGQAMLEQDGFLPARHHTARIENEVTPIPAAYPFGSKTVLNVYAAASLTDVFQAIGAAFNAVNGGIQVRFTFGGSQYLAEQIANGAPADVFASANPLPMERVIRSGYVAEGSERLFAHNRLVVVMPASTPARITTLRDLAVPGLKLVLGSEATAIGHYSLDALKQAERIGSLAAEDMHAVLHNVVGYEETVRSVLARVMRREADAGIVYTSDYYRASGVVASTIIHPAQVA